MTTTVINEAEYLTSTCTLSSDCDCTNEDETPSAECFGCFDDSLEFLSEITKEWSNRNEGGVDKVRVDGSGMGWRGVGGSGTTSLKDIHNTVTLRGDFRVVFTLSGSTLKAERWSHDEPMGGAIFTFTPVNICDDCDNEVKITIQPYGENGSMAEINCPECGVSYDTDID